MCLPSIYLVVFKNLKENKKLKEASGQYQQRGNFYKNKMETKELKDVYIMNENFAYSSLSFHHRRKD